MGSTAGFGGTGGGISGSVLVEGGEVAEGECGAEGKRAWRRESTLPEADGELGRGAGGDGRTFR